MNKAIFLDKDGTIIPDIPYNTDPALISFREFVAESLRQLYEEGYLLIIVSNQSGVAKGFFKEEKLDRITEKLQELALDAGFRFEGFYYCTHDENAGCKCRKPKPGLILKASSFLDIDRKRSWMIGDILNDVEAGRKAGCNTILLDNGGETEWQLGPDRIPTLICRNFKEVTDHIIHDPWLQPPHSGHGVHSIQ